MNLTNHSYQKVVNTYGKKYAQIILQYLKKHNRNHYKARHLKKHTTLNQHQITLGTTYLKQHGHITRPCRSAQWELIC